MWIKKHFNPSKLYIRQFTMKILMFVALLAIFLHGATAVTHSLKYFYTASSGVPNFPEFVTVGLVDEVQIDYCDSNTKKDVPKQDWMKKVTEDRADYWESETGRCVDQQQAFKANIETVKQRFNQTGGVHIVQYMYGCEWDDETGKIDGFRQHGYDGEDFIVFDVKTETWIAPKQEAVITKNNWNNNKADIAYRKQYLTHECPEWLKKYVEFGRSSLMRTERPSVSLLQKTSSSPVSCHATGFYPDRASLFWRKDGEEIHEDVDHGEILPNHDGTFQMSVDLDLSSVDDWKKYDCVFQLSGVKNDIVTKLDKDMIRTNEGSQVHIYVIVAVVVLVLALIIAVIGFMVYKKKIDFSLCSSRSGSNKPEYAPSDTSSEPSETQKLNQESNNSDPTQKLNPESSSICSSQGFHSESSRDGSSQKLNPVQT